MKYYAWIDGYSNAGAKVKLQSVKNELAKLQEKYPDKGYHLGRDEKGLWRIGQEKD